MLTQRATRSEPITDRSQITVRPMANGDGVSRAGEDRDLASLDVGGILVVAEGFQDRENGPILGHVDFRSMLGIGCVVKLQRFEIEHLANCLQFEFGWIQ